MIPGLSEELCEYSRAAYYPVLPGHAQRYPGQPAAWWCSPNLEDWREGDIVLVASDAKGVGPVIEKFQRDIAGLGAAAQWTHAAIYGGNACLIEAVPGKGVVESSVFAYVGKRRVAVRRVLDRAGSPNRGHELAAYARRLLGRRYDWASVLALQRQGAGCAKRHSSGRKEAFFCSALCDAAIIEQFDILLSSEADMHLLPGHLHSHPQLLPVAVGWRAL